MTSEWNTSAPDFHFIMRTFKYNELRIFNIAYEIDFCKGPLFLKNSVLNLYKEFILIEDTFQHLKQLILSENQQREVSSFISAYSKSFQDKIAAFESIFRLFIS